MSARGPLKLAPLDAESPLWPVARRYGWSIPVAAALGFLATLSEGVGISLLIPLLGALMQDGAAALPGPLAPLSELASRFEPDTRLFVVGGLILALVLFKCLIQALNSTFIYWIDGRASHEVRVELAKRLLKVGFPFFLRESHSRLVNIISTDSWRASDAIRIGFDVVVSMAASAVFIGLLLLLDWKLTLAVGLGALLIGQIHRWFVHLATRTGERVTASNEVLAGQMLEVIQGARIIRLFGREQASAADFGGASENVRRNMLRLDTVTALSAAVNESLHAVLFIAVLLGAFFAGTPLPALAAFLVLLYRFQPFLRRLSAAKLALAGTAASVKEVEWLLDPAGKPAAPTGAEPVGDLSGDIVFEGVSFAYPGGDRASPALHDASFRIAKGRTTALIGASGSGKSTIVNLIGRLIEPTAGEIRVGDRRLADLDPTSWRDRIGFAGQDIELIRGSLADNIRYGAPDATGAEVCEAARLARIDAFVDSLPNGYDTDVGEAGIGLSGGQRQRIGLARAFLRRPELLILDEATSAVDALSEDAILKLLADSGLSSTILVVSHRAATLKDCHVGVVLQEGRVVEQGPLETLAAWKAMSGAASPA